MYEQILNRFDDQGIDYKGKHVLIIGNYTELDGKSVIDYTFSEDHEWVCLPLPDYQSEAITTYKPVCFKVDTEMNTMILNGEMWNRVYVYLLRKRD